ncbi:MAG: hypothetical protein WCX77_02640, partial [Candidatus Paceibacterota bacterium]
MQKRGIKLESFTIKTGVKGDTTRQNIEKVINHFKIDNHFFVDISQKKQNNPKVLAVTGKPTATMAVYKKCKEANVLPCGKICNSMIDATYSDVMEERGYTELFTGGDTPKIREDGKYSLSWKKPSGITIIRGGYAFNTNKEKNRQFIEKNNIPWTNPDCGGYDTDCLIPGVFFYNALGGERNISIKDSIQKFPIILEYLAERVRFGIIEREDG